MRNLLRAAAFCACFLIANEGLRYAHNYALRIWKPGTYTEASRLHYQDPCRIAFIGDSIFLTGLDPSLIPDSYNFAWLDHSYLNNYLTLRWMLRANPERLSVVVLPFDRHSFAARRLDAPIAFHKASFFDALRTGHADGQRGRYLRLYLRDRFIPYADWSGTWADGVMRDTPTFKRGFLAQPVADQPGAMDFEQSAARRKRQLFRGKAPLDPRLVAHLRATLDEAAEHNLAAVLVQCPVTREWDEALRQEISDAEFEALERSIAADYPDVAILDYHDRFLDRHEFFKDANHMNAKGAKAFTELLRDDLERLGYLTP